MKNGSIAAVAASAKNQNITTSYFTHEDVCGIDKNCARKLSSREEGPFASLYTSRMYVQAA